MSFALLTYYTKGTPYKEEAKKLLKDCKKLNIKIIVLEVPSQGSWVENTMIKPKIISKALKKYSYDSLVWVDSDARLKGNPILFEKFDEEKIDFGVFQMGSQSRITSGTIFMRNNDKVKRFISDWNHLCKTSEERLGDQHCLRNLIRKNGYKSYKINYKPLPYSYCYVFDDSLRKLSPSIPPLEVDPIILHTQASRRFKRIKYA